MNKLSYQEWLKTLKAGDTYTTAAETRYFGMELYQITISKATEKSIWVFGTRYDRKTGKAIGDTIYLPAPATEAQIATSKKDKVKQAITGRVNQLDKLSQEQLDAILAILNSVE